MRSPSAVRTYFASLVGLVEVEAFAMSHTLTARLSRVKHIDSNTLDLRVLLSFNKATGRNPE